MVLNLDLNWPPCEGASSSINPQVVPAESSKGKFGSPIDVEALDDEVQLLPSSAAFPQRRSQPRRNHRITVDLEEAVEMPPVQSGVVEPANILLSLSSHNYYEASRGNIGHQLYFDLERDDWTEQWQWLQNEGMTSSYVEPVIVPPPAPQPAPPPPPPKEPTFSCPLCMDLLTNPCSTFCGHIFCQGCIEAVIAAASKKRGGKMCPTCRSKLPARKSFHRVYLPNAN